MASMNRGLNLPAIQRIMTEFEKESSMMDMKEDMMSDAVDDVMDEEEDEEEEGDKILKEVLDEIGVGLSQQVGFIFSLLLALTSRRSSPMHQLDWAPHPRSWRTDSPSRSASQQARRHRGEATTRVRAVALTVEPLMRTHCRPD
jgi:hypothetical protein